MKVLDKIKSLFSDDFYRSILQLLTGTTFAKFFPFLFALGLVRIYSPDQFGQFVLELTIASILSIIATAQYENAIIIAEDDDSSRNLFAFGIKLTTIINGMFFLIGLVVIQFHFAKSINFLHLLMIILYSHFFSVQQIFQSKLTRQKSYRKKARIEVFRSVVTGAGQFLFFLFPEDGLLAGAVLGQVIPVLFYAFRGEFETPKMIWNQPILKNKDAIRYINFPKYSLPGELLNFVSSQLPVLVFKPLFGGTILGYYSFSHRYISIPIQLISKSVSGVLVEKASTLRDRKPELRSMVLGLFKKQFLLGIVVFSILGLWGKELFSIAFGKEWEEAGLMAQYISPWLFAVLLGSPLSAMTTAFERQKFSMVFNSLFLAFRVVAIFLGFYLSHSVYFTVALYSFTGFVFFCYLTFYSLRLADVRAKDCLFFILKTSLIVLVPLFLVKIWL
ncbi:MAG TPA: oligosaccharide flippase family protein [Prolixibacteraceae bacterium]|nr:oligosaccharide flippase family protein [Prolixibacteraceae bacterium]